MNTRKLPHRMITFAFTLLLVGVILTLKAGPVSSAQAALESMPPEFLAAIDFPAPESTGQLLASDCNPTGGSGGLAPGRYATNVAGLKATVVVGKGYKQSTPTYLAFLLHGDGGKYQAYQKANNPITKFIDERNWIFVAPQSPNNGDSWWQNQKGNQVDAFARVLDTMFAQYNVCRNVVFGTSGSGGSEFWTSHFFPNKGGQYPAHMVIACGGSGGGGSSNRQKIQALGKDGSVVARSSFYFVYGTKDKLAPMITDSIEIYRNSGFKVYVDKLEGAGHCNKWKDQGFPTWAEQAVIKWKDLAGQVGAN